MIEPELGAIFKRLASMAEDRYSDYAVGVAVMELMEMAMNAVIERQMASASTEATFGRLLTKEEAAVAVISEQPTPLSAAEKMDRAAGVEKDIEERINRSSLNANRTVESNYKP